MATITDIGIWAICPGSIYSMWSHNRNCISELILSGSSFQRSLPNISWKFVNPEPLSWYGEKSQSRCETSQIDGWSSCRFHQAGIEIKKIMLKNHKCTKKTGKVVFKKGTRTFEKHGWEKEHYRRALRRLLNPWYVHPASSREDLGLLWKRERKGTSKIVPCEILKILKNCIIPTLRRFPHFKQLDWLSLKHDPLRFSKFALDKNPTIFCNEEQACLGEWELTLFKWSSQKKGTRSNQRSPTKSGTTNLPLAAQHKRLLKDLGVCQSFRKDLGLVAYTTMPQGWTYSIR